MYGGGIRGDRKLKAVIPGGSSVPILLPHQLDIPASFDGVAQAGSMLGSAGIIVMDETTCMVWAGENLLHFYKHESCGKCTPCREGGDWLTRSWPNRTRRRPDEGHRPSALVANNIMGKTLCAFGDAAATPVLTTVQLFREEYEAHVREGRCTFPQSGEQATRHGRALIRHIMFDTHFIAQLIVLGFTFFMLLNSAAVMVLMERKVAAFVQQRLGPYRVGPWGTMQPLADIIKLMMKEELRPKTADSFLFYLAPISARRRRLRRSRWCRSAPTPRCSACSTSPSS